MKQIKYIKSILFILTSMIVGCSSSKQITKENTLKTPTKIVFLQSSSSSESAVSKFIDLAKVERAKDTTTLTKEQEEILEKTYEFARTSLMKPQPSSKVIEVKNDTIWKHTAVNDKQIGDYDVYLKNDSIRFKGGRNRSLYLTRMIRFSKKKHTITEYPNDTKTIQGIKCYKMVVEVAATKPKEGEFPISGKSIYELYVTKELDLPMHTLFYFNKIMPNIFPMEVLLKQEAFGSSTTYVVTELVF